MSDSKYGRLFTEDDVLKLLAHFVETEDEAQGMLAGADTKFPADEPLFLLRAQDEAAPDTLHDYRHNSELKGAHPAHIGAVNVALRAFDDWQAAHPDRVKTPD